MSTPLSRARRVGSLLLVLFAALSVLLSSAAGLRSATAAAEEPFRLPLPVADVARVLDGGQRDRVGKAVDELYDAQGERLWIVYVRDFGGLDPQTWGDRTVAASGFGDRDLLLSIAVTDRAYALTGTRPSSVSDAEVESLLRDQVEPRLRTAQWAEAGIAAAEGLSRVMSDSGDSDLWPVVVIVVLVVAVIAGLVLLYRWRRIARDRAGLVAVRQIDPADTVRLGELDPDVLDIRSKEILVDVDNAIRTSVEELRLATDEFGATATAPFAAAVDGAKDAIAHAFSIRQRLDDDFPETHDERRDLLVDLISACGRANRELDAKVAEFDAMRNLLIDAPQRLDALTRDVVELTARTPRSEDLLARLVREYPASVIASVRENVTMARERISFAQSKIEDGRTAVARPVGEQGAAVAAIRSAESAIAAGRTLLDAVDSAATDIEQARAGLPGAIEELSQAVDSAATLSSPSDRELSKAVAAARKTVKRAAASGQTDPLGAFQKVVARAVALDHALAAATDHTLADQQLQRRLDQAFAAADGRVQAAADYVATRRGGVDAAPRTRLAEARRHLDRAHTLANTDPQRALRHAERAVDSAGRALHTAQSSVGKWRARQSVPRLVNFGAVLAGVLIEGVVEGLLGVDDDSDSSGWGPGSFGGSGSSGRISRGGRF
ncbi:TPM domain-containing protein [Nocardia sp. NPDC049149]|uniref:TPM domain-containing protein n=1 Tax=Nocardia sp. NPDC049149 TaxID=3364315 RepID=UPI00371428D9